MTMPAVHACKIHQTRAYRQARAALMATVTPQSQCWRCGGQLHDAQHGPKARWTAGHTRDIMCPICGRTHGDPNAPLALEAMRCNASAGARMRNGDANLITARW